jgi:hypothetical protein
MQPLCCYKLGNKEALGLGLEHSCTGRYGLALLDQVDATYPPVEAPPVHQ